MAVLRAAGTDLYQIDFANFLDNESIIQFMQLFYPAVIYPHDMHFPCHT